MSGKAALEAVLPELREPRVAGVGAEPELQEVIVEGGDLFRLQLHRDAPHRLLLVPLHHLHSVCPAVATREREHEAMEPMEFGFCRGMFRGLLLWSRDAFVTSVQSEADLSERLSNANGILIHGSL